MRALGGALGELSARDLLELLGAAGASGTLVLARGGVTRVVQLRGGGPDQPTDLGGAFDPDAAGGTFAFSPNEAPLPTLPSRYPNLGGPLWALPVFAEEKLLSTAETDLRALVKRLSGRGFGGALVLTAPGGGGFILFQEGRPVGALHEAGDGLVRGDAALRALFGPAEPFDLRLHPLPEPVVAAFMGFLLGLRLEGLARAPEGFSGLELGPAGARLYAAGAPYLAISRPGGGDAAPTTRLFAPSPRAPGLALPSAPGGLEGRSYGLTLRGRDALNPLTELSMRFRGEFGRAGQRALEQFRTGGSVEAAAAALSLDLSDLQPTVERLHTEGFIRATGDPSPTPGPRLR